MPYEREVHSTRAKIYRFSSSLDLDVIRSGSRLTCGGLATAKERDVRVAVVHGCFSEGGDSILSAFPWEALRAKLQDN